MAFQHPYGTASSSTHHDPHPQCASNNAQPSFHDDGQTYWYGNEETMSGYPSPSRPSSSSSLAGALDEEASKLHRRHAATLSFPESEVMPVATPLPYSLATTHLPAIHEAPYYLNSHPHQYSNVYSPDGLWPDEGMAYSPQDPMQSPYATYASYHAGSELGCMNGQLVQTGIIGNAYLTEPAPLPSPTHSFHAPLPPSAALSQSRFPLTRSYTLEGAVTPLENRRPARRSINTATPQTPPTEAPASPGAADTEPASPSALARPRQKQSSLSSTTSFTPPPLTAGISSPGLFTRFNSKPPFHHVLASSPTSTGDRSDSEAVLESVVEDVKGPVPPPPAKKKPAMACLFCRERKICCGPPAPDSPDQRCKQCVKRDQTCTFPTECRRGQHKRTPRKATVQALADAASPASPLEAGPVKPKTTTQKERVATASRRARSSDAKPQAGYRSASLVRSKPQEVAP